MNTIYLKEGMLINKLLLVLTLILTLIISSSCGPAHEDEISNNNTSKDDLIVDTSNDTSADSEKPLESDSNNSDTMEDTEGLNTLGNFTTLHKTIASSDRLKQMKASKEAFGTGSKYTFEELKATKIQASIIASMSWMLPNASRLMEHYLEGEGENYELDLEDFLKNEIARQNMYKDVNSALRSAEGMAVKGEKITIYQIEESLHHNLIGDWKYSVGSYFTSVELYDITESQMLGVTYYTAKLKYIVQDYYNWDENDTNNVSISNVSPADLYQLHLNGEAQEFLTYGEEEYEIKWVKGIDASKIQFND